ncbi:MAG: T9SS type A sorting domain-containing protein, partial [Saprospiraceae bacterium]
IGNILSQNKPIKVGNDTDWINIAAGDQFSFAIKKDGSLWSWGNNNQGQLGNGTIGNYKSKPNQIGTENNWIKVDGGAPIAYAIKKDGTLWGWGEGKSLPIQIGNENDWKDISIGDTHIMAIRNNGTLWGWGLNSYGQVGNGTYIAVENPTLINNNNEWVSIGTGNFISLAIDGNGTMWGCGKFNFGFNLSGNVPKALFVNYAWKELKGDGHTLAGIQQDGTLWAWGENSAGQFGDGTTTSQDFPHKIGNSTNWGYVARGAGHTYALKSDGTLWSTGTNGDGQLGLGFSSDNVITFSNVPCPAITSINEINEVKSSLAFNPNPVSNKLLISYGPNIGPKIDLTIYDLNGKQIIETISLEVAQGDFKANIDFEDFIDGIYLVKALTMKGVIIKKILKVTPK